MIMVKDDSYSDNSRRLLFEVAKHKRICWFCGESIANGEKCVKNVLSSIHKDCWLFRQYQMFGGETLNKKKLKRMIETEVARRV